MTAPPRRSVLTSLAVVAIALTLPTACTVGPDYRTPDTELSDEWASRDITGASTQPTLRGEAADVAQWWRVFNDPVLDSLIARAAADNLDLAQATARVRAARASRGVASAALRWRRGLHSDAPAGAGAGGEAHRGAAVGPNVLLRHWS